MLRQLWGRAPDLCARALLAPQWGASYQPTLVPSQSPASAMVGDVRSEGGVDVGEGGVMRATEAREARAEARKTRGRRSQAVRYDRGRVCSGTCTCRNIISMSKYGMRYVRNQNVSYIIMDQAWQKQRYKVSWTMVQA